MAAVFALLALPGTRPAAAAGGVTVDCDTATPSATLPARPGTVRWGINPRVQAGQIGVQQPAIPSVAGAQLDALAILTGGTAGQAGPGPSSYG